MSKCTVFSAALFIGTVFLIARVSQAGDAPQTLVRIKLYPTTLPAPSGNDTDTDPSEPTLDLYPIADATAATAILVLPGGGYTHLSTTREGSDVAHWLNAHGVAAFVLRYRHAPRFFYPVPIADGQRALRMIRMNAADYKVNPQRIGVLGFSAGGHLAASMATGFSPADANAPDPVDRQSDRPDFVALMYPVITFTDEAHVHAGSRKALTNGDASVYAALSPEQHVTRDTPPVFLAHGTDDRTVPVENSVMFYEACHQQHVPAELHLFAHGPHGFNLGSNDPALRVWPDLLMTWMAQNHLVEPASH